ncbi:MAG: hypothetical protein COA84_02465 [Robiginitomaculum sp.]|nr:MAG: hypothetical protein COA84_02465 [Robiginitomaculum sp.]
MYRILFILTLFAMPAMPNFAQAQERAPADEATYGRSEVTNAVSDFFGVTSEAAGSAVESIFAKQGRPIGYIYGGEGSAAIGVGLRYGKGTMVLKDGTREIVYWQGPSIGFDVGGNGSKVFTLIYGLQDFENIYQRFPGVDGSAYLIAGMGINYQRGHNITLVPMRSGAGLRLGASVGYLKYSRKRKVLPF